RIIPILLRHVDWKADDPLTRLRALPCNGKFVKDWPKKDKAFAAIATELRLLIEDEQQSILRNDASPSYPLSWNIPHSRNLIFTGRGYLLQKIHDYFSRRTDAFQPLALSGLGGIGKSQIALEYAYRYRIEYQMICWIQADSHEALVRDFVLLARS